MDGWKGGEIPIVVIVGLSKTRLRFAISSFTHFHWSRNWRDGCMYGGCSRDKHCRREPFMAVRDGDLMKMDRIYS